MTFLELPVKIAIVHHLAPGYSVLGIKLIVANYMVLETGGRTFMHVPHTHELIQIYPFHPDVTLPITGWELSQLSIFPEDLPLS